MGGGTLRWTLLAAVLAVGFSRQAAALSIYPPYAITVTNMCVPVLFPLLKCLSAILCIFSNYASLPLRLGFSIYCYYLPALIHLLLPCVHHARAGLLILQQASP